MAASLNLKLKLQKYKIFNQFFSFLVIFILVLIIICSNDYLHLHFYQNLV